MAHDITAIDKVGLAGNGAWHGLGTVVPEDMDPKQAFKEFLPWLVSLAPVYAKVEVADGKFEYREVEGFNATVREDHFKPLGIVSDKYSVIQHKDMLQDIEIICGESGAKVHTIGSLRGGKRVWALLKLTDQAKIVSDSFNQYIAVMSSHDGSAAYTITPTMVRIVCNNTYTWAMQRANGAIVIKHTANARDAIANARRALEDSAVEFSQFKDTVRALADTDVPDAFGNVIYNTLYPGEATRSVNVRKTLMDVQRNPRGGNTRAVKGTALGVFNAVTEYLDYYASVRKTQGRNETEARSESSLIGAGQKRRHDALQLIQDVLDNKEAMEAIDTLTSDSDTPMLDTLLA